jgi:hypothetical protein
MSQVTQRDKEKHSLLKKNLPNLRIPTPWEPGKASRLSIRGPRRQLFALGGPAFHQLDILP